MNQSYLELVSQLSFSFGLTKLFYLLNRKAKRILTFHNVLPDDLFVRNIANGMSCTATEFRSVIRQLKGRWKFSTDLFDSETITITFDDGYANQCEIASRILEEEGNIPAILFVSGDVVNGNMLLVDELLHWAAFAPVDIISHLGYEDGEKLWINKMWPEFSTDRETQGRHLYDELENLYPFKDIYGGLDSRYKHLRLSGVNVGQMQDLRKRGWLIGWHTKRHFPLSQLDMNDLVEELTCPDEMKDVCLSYPYGREDSVGSDAVELARRMGYPCAVSNMNISNWNSDNFFLPRMSLSSNRYLLDFELSGLKYYMKYHKLLPIGNRRV